MPHNEDEFDDVPAVREARRKREEARRAIVPRGDAYIEELRKLYPPEPISPQVDYYTRDRAARTREAITRLPAPGYDRT